MVRIPKVPGFSYHFFYESHMWTRKIFAAAIIAICLSIVAYGTLAYFTYEDTATNVITAGNIKIAVQEWTLNDAGERVPFTNPIQVMPGQVVSKIAEVKNTGDHTAWIRIALDEVLTLADGSTDTSEKAVLSYNIDSQKWILHSDGYYYYHEPVAAGETTAPLFTEVTFSAQMGNVYQESIATITVHAQGVQKANNGETVFEAAGWPDAE